MGRTESEKLKLAREITAGSRNHTVPELMQLAYDLREENQMGYARRIYGVALSLASAEMRDQVQIKLALATYKDPDLPVDERLKTAEGLLLELIARAESLSTDEHQETLGLLGGVYKQRWSVYAHKDHLEKSV